MMRLILFSFLTSFPLWAAPDPVAMYLFDEESGAKIEDRSGVKPGLDLVIQDQKAVKREKNGLRILKPTLIRSERPPGRLISAVKKTGEMSVSAWITPANTKQAGPARIFSLSKDSTNRNFTLGQEADKYDFRF